MRYLIWDFDGTLGYRSGGWSQACVDVLQRTAAGPEVEVADVRPHLQDGFPWHDPDEPHTHLSTPEAWWEALYPVFVRAFSANGVESERARTLAQRVRETYVGSGWHVYEDVRPALADLSAAGWHHLVLSNHVPELGRILRDLELFEDFQAVHTSAEIGYEKPHPEAFRTVLASLEDDVTVWMIGDSVRADVRGARAVGIPAILVRDSHPDAQHVCPDLSAVRDVLEAN